jgi:hypothetical protein
MPHASRFGRLIPASGFPMGKFFLVIIAISIALLLGTALLVTHF